MIKVNEIAFIGYPTTDKQRAIDFYAGLLDAKPTMDMDMGENYWTEFEIGQTALGLSNYWKPATAPLMGPTLALEVADFDAKVAKLKDQGVPLVEGPYESSVCHMAAFTDPDGNTFWVHKRKPERGAYTGPEISFIGYPVTDRARARKFYDDLLGLKMATEHVAADGFWSEYAIGTDTLALVSYWKPAAEAHMAPSIAFEVEDFDIAVADLKAANVPFTLEPLETPGCFMCVVTDPDNNSIFIHKLKPGRG